jgi:hypothetical protein
MMTTFTTKKAVKLVCRELEQRGRQRDLVVVENESGTIQIEATTDEIEDFEMVGNPPIDSDVIADDLMNKLIEHLQFEELLESNIPHPTT